MTTYTSGIDPCSEADDEATHRSDPNIGNRRDSQDEASVVFGRGDDWERHFSGSNSDRCEAGMITHDLDFKHVKSDEAVKNYTEDDEDWYESEASCEDSGYDNVKDFITTEASRR